MDCTSLVVFKFAQTETQKKRVAQTVAVERSPDDTLNNIVERETTTTTTTTMTTTIICLSHFLFQRQCGRSAWFFIQINSS